MEEQTDMAAHKLEKLDSEEEKCERTCIVEPQLGEGKNATEAFVQRGNEQTLRTYNREPPVQETKYDVYLVPGTGTEAQDTVIHRVYLTAFEQDDVLKIETLGRALEGIMEGNIELKQTPRGILATFDKKVDCTRMIDMTLSKIFGVPVMLWNNSQVSFHYNNAVIIKEVPWCVSANEINHLLRIQNVYPKYVAPYEDSSMFVKLRYYPNTKRSLRNTSNFFHCNMNEMLACPNELDQVIQCYNCQRCDNQKQVMIKNCCFPNDSNVNLIKRIDRFWHLAFECEYYQRCMRCGSMHSAQNCYKPRNRPYCCLCGNSHCTVSRLCPIRIIHRKSVQVNLRMEKDGWKEEDSLVNSTE